MAESHEDRMHRVEWFESLKQKAERMKNSGESSITAGDQCLAHWKSHGVDVEHLPDDEHGILRISIGGGENTPVELNYCRYRGNHDACIRLLEKTILALKVGPLIAALLLCAGSASADDYALPADAAVGIKDQSGSRNIQFDGPSEWLRDDSRQERIHVWRTNPWPALPPTHGIAEAYLDTISTNDVTLAGGFLLYDVLSDPRDANGFVTWSSSGGLDIPEDPFEYLSISPQFPVINNALDIRRAVVRWYNSDQDDNWGIAMVPFPGCRHLIALQGVNEPVFLLRTLPVGDVGGGPLPENAPDGIFGSGDLVEVFLAGKYETGAAADWYEGDWNGDGVFNSSDLVLAFLLGHYADGDLFADAADANGGEL